MEKAINLQDLILGYRFEETYKLGTHSILMQSLTAKEKTEVLKASAGLDYITQLDAIRVPTLARAIVSIDSRPWAAFSEIQAAQAEGKNLVECIEEILSQQSDACIRVLHGFYADLEKKNDDLLQKASKGEEFINPPQGLSGESARSLDVAQKKLNI
jgi:hypothetical protein